MGYKLQIEVPVEATDSNRILGVNKFLKHKIFRAVKDTIVFKTVGIRPPTPLINFKISVIRHGARALDFDNFIASLKPYIDGLTIAGVIKDDSWKYIKNIQTDQIISPEKKLVITVEEN